jgi:hypothetical protein
VPRLPVAVEDGADIEVFVAGPHLERDPPAWIRLVNEDPIHQHPVDEIGWGGVEIDDVDPACEGTLELPLEVERQRGERSRRRPLAREHGDVDVAPGSGRAPRNAPEQIRASECLAARGEERLESGLGRLAIHEREYSPAQHTGTRADRDRTPLVSACHVLSELKSFAPRRCSMLATMERLHGSIIVVGLWCCAACGPAVGDVVMSDGASEGGGSTGEDDATSDGASDSTSADDETTADPIAAMCGAADPSVPLAIVQGDEATSVLWADGSLTAIDLPPSSSPDIASFDARGPWIAANVWQANTHDGAGGLPYDTELVLLAATGERVWSREAEYTFLAPRYIGLDASLVAQRYVSRPGSPSTNDGLLYTEAGDAIAMPDFLPRGPARADGYVPGVRGSTSGVAWFDTSSATIVDASRTVEYELPLLRDSGELVYLVSEEDGSRALVRESPTSVESTRLSELAGAIYSIESSPDGGWMLFVPNDFAASPEQWIRVDVREGIAERLGVELPEAFESLTGRECGTFMNARIDDDGSVLVPARDNVALHLLALDSGASAWANASDPVTAAESIRVTTYAHTYVITTDANPGCDYVFEPSDVALHGNTLQISRPRDDVQIVPEGAYVVANASADGNCVAYLDQIGSTMLHDLTDGSELELPTTRLPVWWSP